MSEAHIFGPKQVKETAERTQVWLPQRGSTWPPNAKAHRLPTAQLAYGSWENSGEVQIEATQRVWRTCSHILGLG